MEKTLEKTLEKPLEESPEEVSVSSTLGIRTIIAIFLFAVFVYCDREELSFRGISAKEIFSQIEWNPLPIDDILSVTKQ